jgi:predicted Rossmann fold nucleotide-binding protein DprA/Smf involved in DNA uptake
VAPSTVRCLPRRNDASLAAILLAQRLVPSAAEPLRAREYWALLDRVDDPGSLLGRSAADLATAVDDPTLAARVVARLDAAVALAFELERLEQTGIRVVASVDADYPARLIERLTTAAPPLLHVVGPLALTNEPMLGVVGSREVAPEGAEVAADAGRAAVAHGWGVVSGGAPGVDRAAMDAALEAGGTVVGFLADPLVREIRAPEVRRAIGQSRLCLATPYPPDAAYSSTNARGRNKLIYAMAETTLVVASEPEGGSTWDGAVEARVRRYGDVSVWTGPGAMPGNGLLVDRGGHAISDREQLWGSVTPSE